MTYPISQPADNAAAYTYTQPIRDSIAAVNDHQTRLTAIEQLPNAKGDIITATADNALARLPVGTNGQVLTAQSTQATGLQWVTGAGGGESSVYNGNKTINGFFGVNATAQARQPVNMITSHNAGSMTGTADKIGFAFGASANGNFTGGTGSNPGFWWGMNMFATTGSSAGDGAGLTDIIGALFELSVQTPSGTTLPHVIGFQAEAAFFGASSGCTVTNMESMRVSAPKRKDGASTGTATNVYGLFIESVDAYNVGTTGGRFSLFVEGGTSRLQGLVTVDSVLQSHNGSMTLQGDYSGNGKIRLTTNGLGFFGVTPISRPTLPASGSVTASDIRTALINLGLCQ